MNGQLFQIALPLTAAIFTVAAYLFLLHRKIGSIPLLDVGTFAVLFTSMYVVIPLIGLLLSGLETDIASDSRLLSHPPSAQSIAAIGWRFDLYLVSLCLAYMLFRGWASDVVAIPGTASAKTQKVLLGVFSALAILHLLLAAKGAIPSFTKYEDVLQAYSSRREWPIWAQQLLNHIEGMYVVVKFALLMFVLRRYEQRAWRVLLILWVGLEVGLALIFGTRTGAVLFGLAALLLFDRLVRPLNKAFISTIAGLSVVVFLAIGVWRTEVAMEASRPVLLSNEFMTVFLNAYDVLLRIEEFPVDLPKLFHSSELLMLIPQQLLPLAKPDPAAWYATLLTGEEDTGQGFAFGIVAQSLLGFDQIELVVRGVVLGMLLAFLHRAYVSHGTSFVWILFYVWLCTHIYFTVRVSTFAPVAKFVFQFMPIAVVVMVLEQRAVPGIGSYAKRSERIADLS